MERTTDRLRMGLRAASRVASLGLQRGAGERGPRFLTHILTWRCDARCQMCDSWRKPAGDELDAQAIADIYSRLPRLDGVRLTGGEPFLRTDIAEIAQAAFEHLRPLYLHVTTNGFRTERVLEFCRNREKTVPLHLMISLDGTEATHDRTRGRKDAYARAFATLREVAASAREWNVRVSANQTVVDAAGIAEIPLLREELSRLGVPHQVVLAYEQSGTYSLSWDEESASRQIGGFTPLWPISEAEIGALIAEMRSGESGMDVFSRSAKSWYRRGLESRLRGCEPPSELPCAALHEHLRLRPDGSVPVCQFNPRSVGNLSQQELSDVLEGEEGRRARRWVRDCPGCWAECEVLPSALYAGSLATEAARALVGAT